MGTRKHSGVTWVNRSFEPGSADTFGVASLQNSLDALSEVSPVVAPGWTFGTPHDGDLWVDTTTDRVRAYWAAQWHDLGERHDTGGERYNIRHFGVIGSGDESVKVQAAIDACVAEDRELFMDAALPTITAGNLTARGPLRLVAEKLNRSYPAAQDRPTFAVPAGSNWWLKCQAIDGTLVPGAGGVSSYKPYLENLFVDGSAGCDYGLLADDLAIWGVVKHCTFTGFRGKVAGQYGYGIRNVDRNQSWYFQDVNVNGCNVGVSWGRRGQDTRFYHCAFYENLFAQGEFGAFVAGTPLTPDARAADAATPPNGVQNTSIVHLFGCQFEHAATGATDAIGIAVYGMNRLVALGLYMELHAAAARAIKFFGNAGAAVASSAVDVFGLYCANSAGSTSGTAAAYTFSFPNDAVTVCKLRVSGYQGVVGTSGILENPVNTGKRYSWFGDMGGNVPDDLTVFNSRVENILSVASRINFLTGHAINPPAGQAVDLSFHQGSGASIWNGDQATELFGVATSGFRVNGGSRISRISVQADSAFAYPSIAAQSTYDRDITLSQSGLFGGDFCVPSLPSDPGAGLIVTARVKSSTTTTVRFANITAAPITPWGGTATAVKTVAIRN